MKEKKHKRKSRSKSKSKQNKRNKNKNHSNSSSSSSAGSSPGSVAQPVRKKITVNQYALFGLIMDNKKKNERMDKEQVEKGTIKLKTIDPDGEAVLLTNYINRKEEYLPPISDFPKRKHKGESFGK